LLLVVIVAIVPMVYETIAWFGDRSARRAGWFGAVVGSLKLDWLRKLTPFESFGQVQGLNYAKGPWSYWSGVIYTGAVGLGGLAYASWRLPRVWQDRGLKGRRAGVFGWVERWWFSGAKGQQQFRTRWLDENPVAWLSGRYWTRRWLVWIFLIGSLTGIWLVGDWVNNGTNNRDWWLEAEVLMLVAFGLHLALKFWVANEAPRQFIDDRQSGALELLLSTPLTVDEILRGRWLALWRQFGGPVLAVLILDVLWIWLILGSRWRTSGEGEEFSLWLAAMVILVADLWALSWDGLWIGLTSKGRAATSWMLTRILVLPWIAWFGFLTGIAAAELRMSESVTGGVLLFVWFILAFVNSLAWGLRARHLLRTSFREMATTKRDTRRGWWRRNPKATSASA
jgi:ABC-type transport system involved in cytochrome c biogenesis permease component